MVTEWTLYTRESYTLNYEYLHEIISLKDLSRAILLMLLFGEIIIRLVLNKNERMCKINRAIEFNFTLGK